MAAATAVALLGDFKSTRVLLEDDTLLRVAIEA
jgi:hypothetical protein